MGVWVRFRGEGLGLEFRLDVGLELGFGLAC